MRAYVEAGPRAERTRRTLRACGVEIADALDGSAPVWLVRAGAWPAERPRAPMESATGRPLVALGRVREAPGGDAHDDTRAWDDAIATSGGDLAHCAGELPPIASAYLDARAAAMLVARTGAGATIDAALLDLMAHADLRVVRVPALDVHTDARLRVAEITTSFQQGGAERIVIALVHALRERGAAVLPVVLGRAMRRTFDAPAETLDLSAMRGDRPARTEALRGALVAYGADVVHAHLLDADDLARLASAEIPVVVTVHNARNGWPDGLASLRAGDAALLIACSREAEKDLRAADLPCPTRTVWNGIAPSAATASRRATRQAHAIPDDAVLLLSVANPRPQKRLHLLPSIARAVERRLGREAHVLVAGDASPAARASLDALTEAIATHGAAERTHLAGSIDDVASLYAAADVLVAPSAYEGLSLVHLEALSGGLPVVTTQVGGAAEIAHPAVHLVDREATAEDYAENVARALEDGRTGALPAGFTVARMASSYWGHLERVARMAAPRPAREGLLLVTNNLSTGGAQSSLRRLLVGLAARGVPVRAATLEERDDHPTPGLVALRAAGIEVLAAPMASAHDPGDTADAVAAFCDRAPPDALLFVNAICEHKVLLADRLYDVPIFDASPGEMYFASMERYFARPRPGLPYSSPRDYGARLAGAIVKYEGEATRARDALGAPVHVIPNGVPLDTARPRASRDDVLVLGTSARIAPQKKLEELLRALRSAAPSMPRFVMRIAGAPEHGAEDYAEGLRREAEGLPIEWLGETDDISAFLATLDLFVMVAEPAGCPNASLEAMAAGLPVVATDVGGASEQVVDGENGRLVARGDEEALSRALVDGACDRERLAVWGRAGRARAARLFDVERMIDDYARVLGVRVRAGARGA